MAQIDVGFIGAGRAADLHAQGYRQHEGVEIAAVCDHDEARAIERSLDWGADAYYTEVPRMLEECDLDAVVVLTPHGLHAEQTIAALERDLHVCVERPIALTIEEADRVAQVAEASAGVLQVYEPCLFHKPLLDGRNLINAGEIGEPGHIRISTHVGCSSEGVWDFEASDDDHWRFDPDLAGDSPLLFDVNYQAFCIALFLVGSIERIEVWRTQTQLADDRTLDAPTTAIWKHFQQECFGTFSLNYTPERLLQTDHHPLEFEVAVTGSEGELMVRRTPDPERYESSLRLRRNGRTVRYGQQSNAFEESFRQATDNFIGACRGESSPLLRGSEAKQLLVLTLAFNESARHSQSVTLQHGS